jgi:hypothetical protein
MRIWKPLYEVGRLTVRETTWLSRVLIYPFVALHLTTVALRTTSNDNGNVHRLELRTAKVPVLADHIRAIDTLRDVEHVSAKVIGDGLRAGGCNCVVCVTRSGAFFQGLTSVDAGREGKPVSLVQQ